MHNLEEFQSIIYNDLTVADDSTWRGRAVRIRHTQLSHVQPNINHSHEAIYLNEIKNCKSGALPTSVRVCQ